MNQYIKLTKRNCQIFIRDRGAIFFSLLRKAVIVAPLTILLPKFGLGVDGIFLAEPISNAIGGLACFLTMYFTVYRKLKKMKFP